MSKKKQVLAGLTFCMTGALSETRKALTALIAAHGGSVSGTVTGSTDYLLAAEGESGTIKYVAAQDKGVPIVSESFLRDALKFGRVPASWKKYSMDDHQPNVAHKHAKKRPEPSSSSSPAIPTKKHKSVTASTGAPLTPKVAALLAAVGKIAAPPPDTSTGPLFGGLVFTLVGATGKADKAVLTTIVDHGGQLAASVTSRVTHVLTNHNEWSKDNPKIAKAKELNIPIMTEDFVHACVRSGKSLTPLAGCVVYIHGKIGTNRRDVVQVIEQLGGRASPNVKKATHVLHKNGEAPGDTDGGQLTLISEQEFWAMAS